MEFRKKKFQNFLTLVASFAVSLSLFFVFNNKIFALDSAKDNKNLEEICQSLIDNKQQNLSNSQYQELLKRCQSFYEDQVEKIEAEVNKTGAKKKTLENQIYLLNKKIKNLNYQIYQSNLVIRDLKIKIEDTEVSIKKTSQKIAESRKELANILKAINEEDKKSTIEILFSENNLSGFFSNLVALERLSEKSKELLKDIKILKENLLNQQQSLSEEKVGLEKTVQIQKLQKDQNAEIKKEQEQYLKLTEKEYLKKVKEKEEAEKKAAAIKAKIYQLIGVRKQVTYKEALKIADYVARQIGVRPALLLGILSQE
ncbi:MAG TPA: hypothetical protein ENL27_02225, partial [Candidatus Parcubacteria bacterium]|nr:hypothetical protein [Candidatus Parcubacteria bacterium]